MAACEPGGRTGKDLVLGVRPGEGRLAGVAWSQEGFPRELQTRLGEIRRAAVRALPSEEERRQVGALRAEAILALLAGRTDRAVAGFSTATRLVPRSAVVRNDLAAALLQRGAARADPHDLFLALAAAHRAVQLDPSLLAARFNRALALERLSLHARALADWRLYRRMERDPAWSREAEARIAALERTLRPPVREVHQELAEKAVARGDARQLRRVVAQVTQEVREHLEEELLVSWAAAELEGNEGESRQRLQEARAFAVALAETNGERMALDTVAGIERLREATPAGVKALARGFRAYGEGLGLLQRGDFVGALPVMEKARKLLTKQRSPFADWATFQSALCFYQHSEYGEARMLLLPLGRRLASSPYRALHGRVLWLLGLIDLIEGDPTAAMRYFDSALAEFRTLRERSNIARVAVLAASGLDYLGQPAAAWRRLYSALTEPATFGRPADRSNICVLASWLAMKQGEAQIALWFQDEVLRGAQTSGRAYAIVGALRWRSAILAALGRKQAAANDLERARSYLASLSDPQLLQSLDGDLRLAEAELTGEDSPRKAIASLNEAVRIFRSTSYHYRLGQALYARAKLEDALGWTDDAERDLEAAIDESELQREKIARPEDRISYFDRTREILDAMIWFQLARRQQSTAAFRYSEQAKARVLLDWLLLQPTGGSLSPLLEDIGQDSVELESLREHLPAGTAVIEYAVLPEHLIVWILRRAGFQVVTVAVGAGDLNELVDRLNRELKEGREAGFLQTSARLYDLLIRPVARHLNRGERIVFIPDGALHRLSFALLRDSRIDRYLIQDFLCSVAPSARILVTSLRRDGILARRRDAVVLAVLDPAFDRELYPSLPRLKGAETEQVIAQSFPGSRVLKGQAATRQAFLQLGGAFEIIHFGGHSVVNWEFPLLSQMLFAAQPQDQSRGLLYSRDILSQRFEGTRLVVLASCDTAVGRISRTEGVENLARPFLASGVPMVIAALWKVDDEITAHFFKRFYHHLQEGFDTVGALRATQIESIERTSSRFANPYAWGAFELIGANVRQAAKRP